MVSDRIKDILNISFLLKRLRVFLDYGEAKVALKVICNKVLVHSTYTISQYRAVKESELIP